MDRKPYNVRLTETEAKTVEAIAFSLGLVYGGRGSIASLVQAIASGDVILIKKEFRENA